MEDELRDILRRLANDHNRVLITRLVEIYNEQLSKISELEMERDQVAWMYNDLRTGTLEIIKTNAKLKNLLLQCRVPACSN